MNCRVVWRDDGIEVVERPYTPQARTTISFPLNLNLELPVFQVDQSTPITIRVRH